MYLYIGPTHNFSLNELPLLNIQYIERYNANIDNDEVYRDYSILNGKILQNKSRTLLFH
jgi:hypothetical protein